MQFFNRAAQAVSTVGDDRFISLGAAPAAHQTFVAAAGAAGTYDVPYLILDGNGVDWEFGIGEVTADAGSGDAFDRRDVMQSTAAGARIVISDLGTLATLYCVHFGSSSVVATPTSDALNLALGPTSELDVFGVLAAGHGAFAGNENATALGAKATASAYGSVALGALAQCQVVHAVASGDGKTGTARGHALTWSGSGTSTGTTSVKVTDSIGDFAVAQLAAYVLDVQVVGRRTAPSAGSYGATIRALVIRSGAGAPTIAGQAKTDITGGLACDCSLSVVSNAIAVNAQGAASGETWLWAATIRATEQRGA